MNNVWKQSQKYIKQTAKDSNYSKTAITILQNNISAFYEHKPIVMDNGETS